MKARAFMVGSVAAFLFACSGCEKSSTYCTTHASDPDCPDAGGDAKPGCMRDDQCTSPTAACDTVKMACVECTTSNASACTGARPVCDVNDTCRGCRAHAECTSSACLPDGACSDGSNVAYVDPAGTDNISCTRAMPCTKIAKALATSRPYVKLTGTTNEQVTINNQNATLLADPGAKLTFTGGPGILLRIDGTSVVGIYDLEIADALGTTGTGLSLQNGNTASVTLVRVRIAGNGGAGISASGGMLTLSQNTISGNGGAGISASACMLALSRSTISNNAGGGVSLNDVRFTLTNNMITNNGGNASQLGGIKLDGITTAGMHVLDFNTITQNLGPATVNTGVTCGTVLTPLVFSNNIVYGNIVAGGGQQLGGSPNCTTTYSDVGPDGTTSGTNINADPAFVNTATRDYHLSASSPCKDAADPAATLVVDVDGDTRPQGSRRDIGADERL